MPTQRLKKFLDDENVKYMVIKHSPAYCASEVAALTHISGKEIAKTVMVKIDGKMAMAVLPSSKRVFVNDFIKAIDADSIEIAREDEFGKLFPGCELGAMPPFGNLYDMEVYVDPMLAEDEEIAFNSGTHTELIRLRYKDFEGLVKPQLVKFTV